ncbi:MAG: HD domain-containing phosphohydrolase [Kiritimatiellia bacterium]
MDRPANMAEMEGSSLGDRLGALHRQLLADVPQVDRIGCALYDPGDDLLKTFINSTLSGEALRGYEFKLSESPALHEMSQSGRLRLLANLPAALTSGTTHSVWVLQEGYRSSLTVPMYGQGIFTGFLFFDSRRLGAFSEADQRHLSLYAHLISLSISGEMLSIRALIGSIGVARAFANLRDFETGAHLQRMSRYARLVAKELAPELELTDEFVEHVFLFASLHDVGKIGIPDRILLKHDKLEGDEWEVMKTHMARGLEVVDRMLDEFSLRHLPDVSLLRNIIEFHHEYLDGSGYPKGALGAEIPLEARMSAVADVFDALTARRPYKKGWPTDRAFSELDRLAAAGKLDARCVAALRRHASDVETIRDKYLDPDEQETTP